MRASAARERSKREPMSSRRIFVSYSRVDREIVVSLTHFVKLGGALVFRDEDAIDPGEDWPRVLQEGIRDCDYVVVFWSTNAAASKAVMAEYGFGLNLNKKIVPILMDDTPLPEPLQRFQWIDYRRFFVPIKTTVSPGLVEAVRGLFGFSRILGGIGGAIGGYQSEYLSMPDRDKVQDEFNRLIVTLLKSAD
jgi:hypothetical protein